MNFSLINVSRQNGDMVEGSWVQDHCAGTLESAIEAAKRTEAVNSNRIDVAVVSSIGPYPDRSDYYPRRRLDAPRNRP